jgi:hypothetical protein
VKRFFPLRGDPSGRTLDSQERKSDLKFNSSDVNAKSIINLHASYFFQNTILKLHGRATGKRETAKMSRAAYV